MMPFKAPGLLLAGSIFVSAAVVISCGGDSQTGPSVDRVVNIVSDATVDTVEVATTRSIPVHLVDASGVDVTGRTAAWTSADTSILAVSSSGAATGKRVGATTLHVSIDAAAADIPVVVKPPAVTRITIASPAVSLAEGDSTQLGGITLVNRAGAVVTDRTATFTSSNAGVALVTPSGLVRGTSPGTATVTVQCDSATASYTVTVIPQPAASLHVTPYIAHVGIGRSLHTQTTAYAASGARLSPRPYTYTSANPAVAAVSSSGVIQGVSAGSTTITVTTNGASSAIPVSVALVTTHPFQIDLRFVGTVSPALRAAATAAAARWDSVITTPLVPYHVVAAANECGKGLPAVNETVTNMIIYVQGDSIDGRGKTAGEGGPCIIRDDAPQLTALGGLTVDTADVAATSADGSLVDLLTHEMGHILGIGTLWGTSWFPNTTTGLTTSDPRFIGHAARVASAALAFTSDSTQGVPIENTGGTGTRDGHWRATIFGHELMTGTLHSGRNPLSLVTIEALADLGYGVEPEAADDFTALNASSPGTFPAPSAERVAPEVSGTSVRVIPINEVVLPPLFTTTRSGVRRAIDPSRLPAGLRNARQSMR